MRKEWSLNQFQAGTQVAIVDDDLSVREALTGFCESLGFAATAFSSSEAFMVSNDVGNFGFIFIDAQMPGMDGLELRQWLFRNRITTPCILMSSLPDETLRVSALSSGAFEFLKKPFDFDMLVDTITRLQPR